jgi:Tfp pilus assembly protein PilF
LIQTRNAVAPVKLARVVDYGDLLALSVLSLVACVLAAAKAAGGSTKGLYMRRGAGFAFGFTATSLPPKEHGKMQLRNDDIGAAIGNFDLALQNDPNDAEAYYLRALPS